MDVYTVKSIVQGVHLAVYSTIKPGGLHRLRLESSIDHIYSNLLSSLEYLVEATKLGERVRRGELAATHLGMGQLLARSLREAYRWNPHHVYPDYIVPEIIYAFALSYAEPDSVIHDYGKIRKALDLVLMNRNWREIKGFIDALKSVHREDMYDHLQRVDVTGITSLRGEASFTDVFRALGSRWPAFRSLDIHEKIVKEYVKKLLEYYQRFGDANNALIMLYLDMVRDKMPEWAHSYIDEAISNGLMASREGSKKLFELDIKLRKNHIGFEEYTGLLAIIAALAVYEGLRP